MGSRHPRGLRVLVVMGAMLVLLGGASLARLLLPVPHNQRPTRGPSANPPVSATLNPLSLNSRPSTDQWRSRALTAPAAARTPTPTEVPDPTQNLLGSQRASCPAVGFYDNSDDPDILAALGSRLSVKATVLATYAWPDVAQAAAGAVGPPFSHFQLLMPAQAETGLQILLGVGAITPTEATAIGDNLVASGYTNTIIRIMWEMNGNWFPWGTQTYSAAQYVTIYRAVEQAFAAVPGNHFTFVWNISAGTVEPGRTEFDTYPGNAYVSSIGIDVYDEWGTDDNLPAIASFAHSVGKPISLDEWGLDGRDDPSFISTIAGFIDDPANDVTLQSYFNYGANAITQYPESEAQYVRDFAGC
jgi:hypothetical protein